MSVQVNTQPQNNQTNNSSSVSYFDGGVLGYVGITILTALIILCTFGIALPWAVCLKQDWITQHTVIGGRRLEFNGTGFGLFGTWIKIFLLTIITLGIYGLWAYIVVQKWIVSHTEFSS